MENGKKRLDALEFEQQMDEYGDDQLELIKFFGRQLYDHCNKESSYKKRIEGLESRDRKWGGIGAGIGGTIASIFWTVVYLIRG